MWVPFPKLMTFFLYFFAILRLVRVVGFMFPLQISKLLEIFTVKAERKIKPETGFKYPERLRYHRK